MLSGAIIKALGIGATVIGMGAGLITDYVNEKKMEKKMEEMMDQKLSDRFKNREES